MKDVQSLPWMSAYFVFATVVDFVVGRFVLTQVKNRFSRKLNKTRTKAGFHELVMDYHENNLLVRKRVP